MKETSGENSPLLSDSEDSGSFTTSTSQEENVQKDAELFETTITACGFGWYQVTLLFACGWALASDSVEIQVVSFVLPSACDLNMNSTEKGWLNAIIFVGMMVGGYLFGGAADQKGRRFVLLWSMTINGVFGLSSAFAPMFWLFMIFRFMSGVGVGAAMPVMFSYFVEFMAKEKRGPMIGFMASFWMLGNILTAGIAWLIIPRIDIGGNIFGLWFSSWRIFVAVGAFPSLSASVVLFFLPESPKFLQMAGRPEEATQVFIKMHRTNFGSSKPIPREIKEYSEAYHLSMSTNMDTDDSDGLNKINNDDSYIENPQMCMFSNFLANTIFTLKKVLRSTRELFVDHARPTWVLIFVWFTLSFGFYGLWMWFPEIFRRIQNGGSTCGHSPVGLNVTQDNKTCLETVASDTEVYFESFLVAISNLPGNILVILLINKVGRREILACAMVLSGVSVFFFWLVKTRTEMIVMSCIFSGISVAGWNALDAIAVENYPTHLRSTAFGFQTTIGRIAAIMGNLVFGELVDVHCSVPLLLVAGLLAAGGLSALKLPRTDKDSLK